MPSIATVQAVASWTHGWVYFRLRYLITDNNKANPIELTEPTAWRAGLLSAGAPIGTYELFPAETGISR